MARVAEWWCHVCKAELVEPISEGDYVHTKVCPKCGKGKMGAWGRAAFEDYALEVIDEVAL